MAQTNLTIRIDENLKKEMENVCESLGMNMTSAITIYAKKLIKDRKIPFEIDDVMTTHEKMLDVCNYLIKIHGPECIVTYGEITDVLKTKYGITKGNLLPSDYCYNKVNKGIYASYPYFFEALERGQYRCLGEGYTDKDFDVTHTDKNGKEEIVGKCITGERQIYKELE